MCVPRRHSKKTSRSRRRKCSSATRSCRHVVRVGRPSLGCCGPGRAQRGAPATLQQQPREPRPGSRLRHQPGYSGSRSKPDLELPHSGLRTGSEPQPGRFGTWSCRPGAARGHARGRGPGPEQRGPRPRPRSPTGCRGRGDGGLVSLRRGRGWGLGGDEAGARWRRSCARRRICPRLPLPRRRRSPTAPLARRCTRACRHANEMSLRAEGRRQRGGLRRAQAATRQRSRGRQPTGPPSRQRRPQGPYFLPHPCLPHSSLLPLTPKAP